MDRSIGTLALLSLMCCRAAGQVVYGHEDPSLNKVANWDLESSLSDTDWIMDQAEGTIVPGGYTGAKALHVHTRVSSAGSPHQTIDGRAAEIRSDTNYYLSMYLKFLNPPTEVMEYISTEAYVKVTRYNGAVELKRCGRMNDWLYNGRWQQLGADFKTPRQGVRTLEIYLRVSPASVDYLLDTVALTELARPVDWRERLDRQIDQHRRDNFTLITSFAGNVNVSAIQIDMDLMSHEFGFGTAVRADHFNRQPAAAAYRDFILDNFNLAVFENDMKWRSMEKTKGAIKVDRVDKAMSVLQANNLTVRGHTLHWDIMGANPNWVQELEGPRVAEEVSRRITYMMEHFRGRVPEWDVCNEYLQQRFLEEASGDRRLLEKEFHLAHSLDPAAKLCLNDYLIARGNGWMASAQANLARNLLAEGVPCHCVGVQSHLRELPLDVECLQKRIEIASSAGLPISITELSVHSERVSMRARGLDTALRVYFAAPAVTSITLWGFSDQYRPFASDYCLTEGPDFKPNAAGRALLSLLKEEWHTRLSVRPGTRKTVESLRGFRGTYRLTVTEAGHVLHQQTFQLGRGRNRVRVRL